MDLKQKYTRDDWSEYEINGSMFMALAEYTVEQTEEILLQMGNVGGAASAPVVAAAFHPALAPVGVLLAVLGYALGTYGAILCAQMMAGVS